MGLSMSTLTSLLSLTSQRCLTFLCLAASTKSEPHMNLYKHKTHKYKLQQPESVMV